mmetsp:Transcript_85748/g.165074  ORF Transcript_85748/g.165074 Transcript_85748/m.165074 type:complete len:129 (+) Transcript_85748:160-546(+)
MLNFDAACRQTVPTQQAACMRSKNFDRAEVRLASVRHGLGTACAAYISSWQTASWKHWERRSERSRMESWAPKIWKDGMLTLSGLAPCKEASRQVPQAASMKRHGTMLFCKRGSPSGGESTSDGALEN